MLEIKNNGVGYIGEISPGWTMEYNASPITMGSPPGRMGALNFSARCDNTSKFTIDNYVSIRHFFDDRTQRWLSGFDGNIRAITTNDQFGQFTVVSLLSALDADGRAESNPSGKLQRSIRLPAQIAYQIGATTYYTGGFYQLLDGINTWNARSIPIYDVSASENYLFVLAGGSHNGEVVFVLNMDGSLFQVWPVYSDSTDTSNPGSRYISFADSDIYVAQVNADRIKRFAITGQFNVQWGGSGTGNGQFGVISGLAANGYGSNAVYVTDSSLGRVQWFTKTGTYTGQFGTSGTGSGNLTFNAPNGISIEPSNDHLFVSDQNARVREYTATGTYVGQPMGSYDFVSQASRAEFRAGGHRISTCFDSRGRAYAIQGGQVFKFAKDNTGWPTIALYGAHRSIQKWKTPTFDSATPQNMICSNHLSGIIHIPRTSDYVDQYSGSMGNIVAYFLYYIALGSVDFPVRIMKLNDIWGVNGLAYIPWEGNVWDHLCAMCAATDNSMVMLDDKLCIFQRTKRHFPLPPDTMAEPIEFDSRATGLSITAVNYNSRFTVGEEVIYSSLSDNRRSISVDQDSEIEIVLESKTYAEYIRNPVGSNFPGDGLYTVVDSNDLQVSISLWNSSGGRILMRPGDQFGQMIALIIGPYKAIANRTPPYKIATTAGTPSLSIIGAGVVSNPEIVTVGTGVSPLVTSRQVARHVDYPFAHNAQVASTEATWGAYTAGTPHQRIKFTFSALRTHPYQHDSAGVNGTGFMINHIVKWGNAQYVVDEVTTNGNTITLTCFRYTRTALEASEQGDIRFEEIWASKTAGEFDAFWARNTAQDFTIAPLMNPFGL